MAATALQICTDALKELGVLAEGDTPTASMANDTLRALNRIMELFSNDQSFAYYPNQISQAMTGQASFTVGPTGNLVSNRPIRIESATVDRNGITYPVDVYDNLRWDSIAYKAIAGANTAVVWYEGTFPDGIVHVWPLCSGATLNMRVVNLVVSFPTLGTTVNLPPGYEECLIKNLAVNISPQYPAGSLNPLTIQAAENSLRLLQRGNNVIPLMTVDRALLNLGQGSYANFMGGF